jgi:hypothetical protein
MRQGRDALVWLIAVAGALLLGLAGPGARSAEPATLVAGFPRGQALLETSGPRCLLLDVYYATTMQQRAQGLMYVERMEEFEGMYFASGEPAELTMWMKNTILPLDMMFVSGNGTVTAIARDTQPYSTAHISSGGPVSGVLEVNGGFARRWQVTTGTRLLHF